MTALTESLTLIDVFIAFMVLMGLWRGFTAGFAKTAASLVAWLSALIIASRIAKEVSPFLAGFIENPVLQIAAAFLLVALGVVAVVHLLTSIITGALKTLKLGFVDRLLGGVLGAATGILKVLIILSIASPLLIHLPNWQQSILAQNLLPLAPIAMELLQEALGGAWQQIQNPYQSS
ncbi:colicin V production protein [Moraxella ovis]|uniref:Colicin V production protein n=1 Tax=Moraxella ovis TaxID=29433 RepID=A0A378PPZ5_9GAMM|nr:CvpA family protein [Moraxella ovis]ANB91396.1 colicin V production protein [Moraxella ovis]STY86989.1 colicin V production protein [Moraxella ovis]